MTSIPFSNRYSTLGEGFFVRTPPSPVSSAKIIRFNTDLAKELGLDIHKLNSEYGARIFSGNEIPEGADPLAMVYAGHQFGMFSPQLGDGRALLLGEVTDQQGRTYGIQLKGSGLTAFSRNGDGRAALGPVLREYLMSEAMHRLGVPTTRALAAVTTGENVFRERALPGAVITRVASSFIRVGTFEFYARRGFMEKVQELADYVIKQHYPNCSGTERPYLSLLESVIRRQAMLVSRWMQLGFIHGVMNTDNMSVAGETIDYGPCAFMDHFNFNQVYSSIDHQGRYAYSNQPGIALWNLTRFAECLAMLLDDDRDKAIELAKEALGKFMPWYEDAWLDGMLTKSGILDRNDSEERYRKLLENLLTMMNASGADFTLTFRSLASLNLEPDSNDNRFLELHESTEQARDWLAEWRQCLRQESFTDQERKCRMHEVNPAYIPRNHRVEAAIRAAENNGDFSVFHTLHEVLENPYELQHGNEEYQRPPQPHEVILETFCGT